MDPSQLLQLLNDYGLPLVGLVLLGVAFIRGSIVPGRLYEREYDARVKAEERLDAALAAMKDQTGLLEDIEREVLRGQSGIRP